MFGDDELTKAGEQQVKPPAGWTEIEPEFDHHQDDQVIDYIEAGVEPEDAVETARAFMEHNNRQ